MNSTHHDGDNGSRSPAEETLRMLAKLPAPDGISARVQASLRSAPRRSSLSGVGAVFGMSGWMHSAALRTAAAAGIVCVVAGGGWKIYSRVQMSAGMQGVAVPVRVSPVTGSEGGFSTSGAIARPDPLKAPVIAHQFVAKPAQNTQQPGQSEKKVVKKRPARMPAQAPADQR